MMAIAAIGIGPPGLVSTITPTLHRVEGGIAQQLITRTEATLPARSTSALSFTSP